VGEAITWHHNYQDYTGDHKDILYSIVTANRFASLMEIGFSGDRYPEKIDNSIYEALGISKEAFDDIEKTVNAEIEKAQVFLKI
jgi:hypothetical protein